MVAAAAAKLPDVDWFCGALVIYGINGLHRISTFSLAQLNAYVRFLRDSIGLNCARAWR